MNCEFVNNRINDYFEKNLSEDDLKKFKEHSLSCPDCQQNLTQYKKYFNLLERVEPGFEPPENLLENISDGLMGETKEQTSETKFDKKELDDTIKQALKLSKKDTDTSERDDSAKLKISLKVPLIILTFLGIAAAAILIYLNIDFTNEPWKIDQVEGKYSINNSPTGYKDLKKDDIVFTNESSSLRIEVPATSFITLNGNTQVVISNTEDKNNVVKLIKGGIKVKTYTSQPFLKIKTDIAELTDLHAKYSMEVDNDKNYKIQVDEGLIVFSSLNLQTPIGAGYYLEMKNGYDLGVPYRLNASPVLIEELDKYLFKSGGLESLQNILSAAVEEDAVTLWNLIRRVDKNEIILLYDKLNTFYPVPEGVTKRLVMNLKKDILDLWWQEIEWQL